METYIEKSRQEYMDLAKKRCETLCFVGSMLQDYQDDYRIPTSVAKELIEYLIEKGYIERS